MLCVCNSPICENSQQGKHTHKRASALGSDLLTLHMLVHTNTGKHALVYTHVGAVCAWPDKLLLSNSHPFIYQTMWPRGPPRLCFHPFFFLPSFNRSLARSYLLPYHCLPPQITAMKGLKGHREMVKKKRGWGESRGEVFLRVFSLLPNNSPNGQPSLSVNTGPQREPADWMDASTVKSLQQH